MPRLCVDKQARITAAIKKCVDNGCLIGYTRAECNISLWKTEEKCVNSGETPTKPINSGKKVSFGRSRAAPSH
jgi:hypothetical protein